MKVSVCVYVPDVDGPEKQRGESENKRNKWCVLWGGSQASLIPYVCIWPHFRKVADFVQKAICTVSLTFSGAETDGEHLNVCVCVCVFQCSLVHLFCGIHTLFTFSTFQFIRLYWVEERLILSTGVLKLVPRGKNGFEKKLNTNNKKILDSLWCSGLVSLLPSQAHQHHGHLTNFWCFWQFGEVPNPAGKWNQHL